MQKMQKKSQVGGGFGTPTRSATTSDVPFTLVRRSCPYELKEGRSKCPGQSISVEYRFLGPSSAREFFSGKFAVKNLSYVATEQLDLITSATDYVPVPHMTVNFTMSRKKVSDIIVLFSSICSVEDPTSLQVRTKLDGTAVSFPEDLQFSGMIPTEVRDWAGSCHSYPFVFQKVPRGPHSVTAEFRGASRLEPNLQVILACPSLVVAYQ
jgi:hypothetical protein